MSPLILPSLVAAGLYLAAAAALVWRLAWGEHGREPAVLVAAVATSLHTVALGTMLWSDGGLTLGLFNTASLVGWLMSLMLIVAAPRQPVADLGIVIFPFCALAVAGDVLLTAPNAPTQPLAGTIEIHISLAVLAHAVLGLAAAQATLVAVQDYHLRHHRPGGFIRRLPPLQTMEALQFSLLRVGFALLTFGLITGLVFVEDLFSQHLVHKTVLSIAAWVVFGVLLWGHHRYGWRGQTATRSTLAGFAVLAVGFFGSKIVLELILQR